MCTVIYMCVNNYLFENFYCAILRDHRSNEFGTANLEPNINLSAIKVGSYFITGNKIHL